jgi:glycosyltransferase 2 family protein
MAQLVRLGSFFIPLSIGAQEGGNGTYITALGYRCSLRLAASLIGHVKQFTWVSLGLGLGLGQVMAFKQSNIKNLSN